MVTLALHEFQNANSDAVTAASIKSRGYTNVINVFEPTVHVTEATIKATEKAQRVFGASVKHVVTGLGIDVEEVQQVVASVIDGDVLVYECHAVLLRKLEQAIAATRGDVIAQLGDVLRMVRDSTELQVEISRADIPSPPSPNQIDNNMRATLDYLTTNWSRLADVMANAEDVQVLERMEILRDMQARRDAYDLLAALTTTERARGRIEKDTAALGDAAEMWMDVAEEARNLQTRDVTEVMTQHSKQVLQQGCLLAANLMDPRYFGQRLSPAQLREAMSFIQSRHSDIGAQLTEFIARATPYDFANLNADNPAVWWTAGRRLGFDATLCDAALNIVTATPTAFDSERPDSLNSVTRHALSHLDSYGAEKYAFCYSSYHSK